MTWSKALGTCLLVTLLCLEGASAKQSFLPQHTTTKLRPSLASSRKHENVANQSVNKEGCDGIAFFGKRRCLDVRGGAFKRKSIVNSVLSVRGGGGSVVEPNMVQTIVKSLLSSSALPEPIKNFIEMICQLLESITGWGILPPAERKSKAKKGKPRSKEVLVEEVSVTAKKKRTKRKRLDESPTVEGVSSRAAVSTKSKKKTTTSSLSDAEISPKEAPAEEASQPKPTVTTKPKQTTKTDAASKKFLSNDLKSSNPNYRIQRELKEFLSSPPPGLSVKISGKNVRLWVITLSMPDNCIYAGEKYKLRVQFPNDYPTSPPSVFFLPPTPRHEHVYTNGDICLSLLGKDWRPIMTAQSIAQAIFSILCGAQRKSLPMDNARHAGNKPGQAQNDWVYHDDNC